MDNDNIGGEMGTIDENGDISLTFELDLPSQVRGISTYAMSQSAENAINTLDILVFKVESNIETFVYRTQASKIEDDSDPEKINIKHVTVKLKASDEDHRLVFLANVTDEIDALNDISTVGEKDDILARLLHKSESTKQWGKSGTDYFPMWGESKSLKLTGNPINETIQMLRALARVDVIVDLADGEKNGFILKTAYLYNYSTVGHVVPDPANMAVVNNKNIAQNPTLPADPLLADKSLQYEADPTDGIVQQIYTYEREKDTEHLDKISIVIGGSFVPDGYTGNSDDLKTTYYRADFVDSENKDIDLLRNHLYTFKIKSIQGDGYEDEDEAHKNKSFNLTVDVLEWDQGTIKDIVFNDQYFLGVSESEIYLPKPAKDSSIIVTTDYPGGWTRTWEAPLDKDGKEWFTVTSSNEYSGEKELDELTFRVTENNDGNQRIAKVHLKAGLLKHTITVYQGIDDEEDDGPPEDVNWLMDVGDANCYILNPKGDGIRMPVSQANADGIQRIGDDDELEVEVLWTDTEAAVGDPGCVLRYVGVSGKGNSGYLEVVANKTVVGNALIAVKVDNVIRWSWHIWVLEYEPEKTELYFPDKTNPSIILMDRNLGALSNEKGDPKTIGLTYQWGRKDPFPGLKSFNSQVVEEVEIFDAKGQPTSISFRNASNSYSMLEESIMYPMQFIRGSSTFGDWYGENNNQNNKLWYDGTDVPTPYDPCPDGWTTNIEKAFWDSNNWAFGFNFDTSLQGAYSDELGYWPATGHRNVDGTFNVSEVGNVGFYWIGESTGGFGSVIRIDKNIYGYVNMGYSNERARGTSIRCRKK